jgi:HNH endonuclease
MTNQQDSTTKITWTRIINADGSCTSECSNLGEFREQVWTALEYVVNIDGAVWYMPPNFYEASSVGNVRSKNTKKRGQKTQKNPNMESHQMKTGYLRIGLSCTNQQGGKSYKRQSFLVHRVIRYAFLPHHPTKKYVHHNDNDKTNNALENLTPCTQKFNVEQTFKTENCKTNAKAVEKYKIDDEGVMIVVSYASVTEATRLCKFKVDSFLYTYRSKNTHKMRKTHKIGFGNISLSNAYMSCRDRSSRRTPNFGNTHRLHSSY